MDKASLVRTVILVIALANQVLVSSGHSVLPISDEDVATFINTAFTIAVAVWTWWKNNYVGSKGKKQALVLDQHDLK